MKVLFLLLVCLVNSGCGSIYRNLSDEDKKQYKLETIDIINHKAQPDSTIYSIDSKELFELIKRSDRDYQVVLLFSLHCNPNMYITRDMIKYFINDSNVQLYIITQSDQTDKYLFANYFKYPNLKRYMLNSERYNLSLLDVMEQSNPARQQFLSEICATCDFDPGSSVAVLLNKEAKVLFYPGKGYGHRSWKDGVEFEEFLKAVSKQMNDDIKKIINTY